MNVNITTVCGLIEFFRIEFYTFYRICRKLFFFKIAKNSILQNL